MQCGATVDRRAVSGSTDEPTAAPHPGHLVLRLVWCDQLRAIPKDGPRPLAAAPGPPSRSAEALSRADVPGAILPSKCRRWRTAKPSKSLNAAQRLSQWTSQARVSERVQGWPKFGRERGAWFPLVPNGGSPELQQAAERAMLSRIRAWRARWTSGPASTPTSAAHLRQRR